MKTTTVEFYEIDRHFQRIAWGCVLLYGTVALVMNLFTAKQPERQDYTQLSPRIAKMIIEAAKPLPPPPAPPAQKKEETKAEEKPKEEPKPEQAKEAAPPQEVAKREGPTPEEIQAQQEAQRRKNVEVAMNSGLLKLLKQSDSRDEPESVPDAKLKKVFSEIKGLSHAPRTTAGPGLQAPPTGTAGIDDIVSKLEKSIQQSKPSAGNSAVAGSGGINQMIGNLNTDVGGSSLAERKTTAVESPFQIKGSGDGKSPRNNESIAEVVDSYKGGISFLYNKALRENPALRGTVTVEFIIAASGEVIDCRVVSSSMKNTPFEEALVKRILQWKFPPVSGGDVTIVYPIVFSVAG